MYPAARETADRLRSGSSDNGDETVTDTSTPPSAEQSASSAPAASTASSAPAASSVSSVAEAAEATGADEAKKSESVASDGDLFRQSEIAADYVEGLLDILDYDGDIDELVSAGRPMVEVVGGRLQPLVGQRGATLEALQELTRLAIFRATGSPSRLLLDIGGYRAARRKELAAVARNAVEKVKEHGDPVRLEAMSAFERKCVHDVVNAIPGVQSESEGVEPNRRIVVRVAD
ncbi:R3H domain-containing nucleic acid-binding protein [Actinoplanes sp. NPDC051861]|uniref:Jag family protein n=1 Tax=Actinoplanes sp. NPDC051861 TaxID=3155170 RepID=UPI003444E71F